MHYSDNTDATWTHKFYDNNEDNFDWNSLNALQLSDLIIIVQFEIQNICSNVGMDHKENIVYFWNCTLLYIYIDINVVPL